MTSPQNETIPVAQAFDLAVQCHRSGDRTRVEWLCRQILHVEPRHAGALHLLGLAAHQAGLHEQAVDCLGQVLHLQPDNAEAHNNLGVALRALGRLDAAAACYREALRCRPNFPGAYGNLGNVLQVQGRVAEAAGCFEQALALRPDSAEMHNSLGRARLTQGKPAEAEVSFREAVRLQPDHAEAHHGLGVVHLGAERLAEAAASFARALRLRPGYAEALNGLGCTQRALGQLDDAAATLREALRVQPGYPEASNNLGLVFMDRGQADEALACYGAALAVQPDFPEPHNNRGYALDAQGRAEEALACYEEAVRLRPDYIDAQMNRAMSYLLLGHWQCGWPEYEWRWRMKGHPGPSYAQPPWDGRPLEGRTVLLVAEQGLGDTLQFVRYAPLVRQCGGRVVLHCQDVLLPLLARTPGLDALAGQSAAPPPFDCWAPLLSLPRLLGTTPETVPANVPYLFADPVRVERWGQELAGRPGFRVGIAWQGNPKYAKDRYRSIHLRHFAPLAKVEGVRFLALQKGPGREQLREAAGLFPVDDLGPRLDEGAAFVDTAAVLKGLDLLITSDSAVAHLAGGLGVRAWVVLARAADWRWLLGRDDSPWYPSVRLFRQEDPGDWSGIFRRIADQLQELHSAGSRNVFS